jgi:formylglycine-generating enzyme required for sulfatase activity
LVADLDAYVGGFATSAEGAGVMRRVRLWVGRNRVVVGAAALFVVMGGGFTAKVIAEGRRASRAMKRLLTSAPVFAARAEELLRGGDFQGALEAADNAVDLDASVAENHVVRGNALQVLMRLEEAKRAYGRALEMGKDERAAVGLKLTEEVIAKLAKEGDAKGKLALYEGLNRDGRQMEALAFGRALGDVWETIADRRRDRSVIPDLINRLEAKMLPVPGTGILLSKTEFTVGEWKLYLKAEGLPEWQQPAPKNFIQTDEHPVINGSWNDVSRLCEWLSKVSGKKWRLPKNEEWEAAVGKTDYPWGDYFPPNKYDGNYAIRADGTHDSARVGIDGFKGTTPVGSFKANALGFFDLGGNVWELMLDGYNVKDREARRVVRGGSWWDDKDKSQTSFRGKFTENPLAGVNNTGFRIALSSVP